MGNDYWGSFHRFALGPGRCLWIGVSVPETDLLATTRHDPLIILGLSILALFMGIISAFVISGQMSKPLTALLARSKRIGALELDPQPSPPTALREVRDLGGTIEQMGEALRQHLEALERARVALIDSEQRFRSTFEQAAVGMCHLSTDGKFIRVNQRLCDILGRSRDEVMQLSLSEVTHPEHITEDRQRIRELIEGDLDSGSWEKRYIRPTGEIVWGQVTTRLLRDASKQPRYFITVILDITERRALEAQLRQVQKLEAVGQLAGGVAHDFNNLLTVVSGHALLARKALASGHAAHSDIEQIELAAERAADLTRQLLAFARREIVEPKLIHPGDLVTRSQRMLRRLIDEHVQLDTRIGEISCVRIDPG